LYLVLINHRLHYKRSNLMVKMKDCDTKKLILDGFKGALVSVCVSLVAILVFAFVIKLTGMSDGLIKPINQIIKALSIFFGTNLVLKKTKQKGLITGIIIGLCYSLFAFIVFSILNGKFCFDITLLIDILFGGIMGAICGVICVNLKK
ncbi:MAG: TIGR04086 family membrane protein, partial [Clostridiales bacterium]|nr:TIGR04086 family membrane protein [Candidatus Apopatousia equi]